MLLSVFKIRGKCMSMTEFGECLWKNIKLVLVVASGNEKWEAENQWQEGAFFSLFTV